MTVKDLVRMVNQIAEFYRSYPRDEAVPGIAGHIRSFWDPRMREALARYVSEGGEGLSDTALEGAREAVRPA